MVAAGTPEAPNSDADRVGKENRPGTAVRGGSSLSDPARVRVHQPDVVMLDLALSVMAGFQALPLIRQEASRAKVIVVSGADPYLDRLQFGGP